MTAKLYTVAGRLFHTQTALEQEIKFHLAHAMRDTVFVDILFRDIVNGYHPEVIAAGQKSDGRFEYLSYNEQVRRQMRSAVAYRGGPLMTAYFEPLGEWRDVTVYPWRNPGPRGEVRAALRAKSSAFIPSPTDFDLCSAPGCAATGFQLQYHHVTPTFAAIVTRALTLVSEEEVAGRFGYQKFIPGAWSCDVSDFIPDDHPAVQSLAQAHKANKWCWLCRDHHQALSKERRAP